MLTRNKQTQRGGKQIDIQKQNYFDEIPSSELLPSKSHKIPSSDLFPYKPLNLSYIDEYIKPPKDVSPNIIIQKNLIEPSISITTSVKKYDPKKFTTFEIDAYYDIEV